MPKLHSLLSLRLKPKKSKKEKITALAEFSKKGNFTDSLNMFRLSDKEKEILSDILKKFQEYVGYDSNKDLKNLITITSEVKAITSQAIILHGERIQKARNILKNYKEGAFTAWLIATYGNRQTPYNFLQYFELHSLLSSELKLKIDTMPRQAVYSLASRSGELEKKEKIIEKYQGETKAELLEVIRQEFPLDRDDKRLPNIANQSISSLNRLKDLFSHSLFEPNEKQKNKIYELLEILFETMKKY
jgi:hypothetical protein